MGKSLKTIGPAAFWGCTGIKSIIIPESVTSIEQDAFEWCSNLAEITIPNSVESIGKSAFEGCSALTSITLPNSITKIECRTFEYCDKLTSVTIPNSVTNIEYDAFSSCPELASVIIPESVKSIGSASFNHCNGLTSVTNLSKTPQEIEEYTFTTFGDLHVLPRCKAAYEEADYWKNFNIIEDAVALTPEMIMDMIDAIGNVEHSNVCKAKIDDARSAYDALTKEQQALVKNYATLLEAEDIYSKIDVTGITNVNTNTAVKNGKYIVNGKIQIIRNGKIYDVNGLAK